MVARVDEARIGLPQVAPGHDDLARAGQVFLAQACRARTRRARRQQRMLRRDDGHQGFAAHLLEVFPPVQAGKLRALGVTSAKRSATLPGVPTIAEAGVPGYEVSPWFAVFAPAGTPAAIVNKINAALIDAMKQPDTVAKFETIGAEPIGTTPQQLATHLDKELARWGALIKERNIRMD